MASQLSAFLIANGATDTRGSKPAQQAKDANRQPPSSSIARRPIRPAPQEAARPDGEPQQAAKPDGVAPGPDGRKSAAKQKLSKRGKAKPAPRSMPPRMSRQKRGRQRGHVEERNAPRKRSRKLARKPPRKPRQGSRASGCRPARASPTASPTLRRSTHRKRTARRPALRPDPVPPVTPAPSMSAAVSSGTSEPSAAPAPPLLMLPAPPPARDGFRPAIATGPPRGTACTSDLPIDFRGTAVSGPRSDLIISRVLL